MKSRRRLHPRVELAQAFRVAARNIADAEHRRIAANQAGAIPVTYPERFRKGWGAVASIGRSLLRALPECVADQRATMAENLRLCADVVQHGDTVVSETSLHDRRQRRA